MYRYKFLKLLLPISWLIISFYYVMCNVVIIDKAKSVIEHKIVETSSQYNISTDKETKEEEQNDFLIDTPGCSIPNYSTTLRIEEAKVSKESTCGIRAVFVKKISEDKIVFTIDYNKMKLYTKGEKFSCCYQFGFPLITEGNEDYRTLRYSPCKQFQNDGKEELQSEILYVTCVRLSKNSVIYEDSYAILKKRDASKAEKQNKKPWNVLILGMDTMSRARAYSSMPKTVDYMLRNNWLDYRGFQKVGYNTFPNVMSLLTGKDMSTVYHACSSGMDNCNHLMIWSHFKNAGYVTATGEEYLKLPDTFSKFGFKSPPTDHYLRPFFLTGESGHGNIICTKKTSSAKIILDYAATFGKTYREENFFGMFWFNSYSHNTNNVPTLIDQDIVNFFSQLDKTGVLNNTFVYFLSDHGIRNGKMRVPYESYYEERLPMLFLWVPRDFRSTNQQEYKNLKLNQKRLVTPYDIHLTLQSMIPKSENSTEIHSKACPNCTSTFNEISIYRTCEDAGVTNKWCTCHELVDVDGNNNDGINATNLAVTELQKKMEKIKSTHCMKCEVLKLKNVIRTHKYRDETSNSTYFVIAFVMVPGDVAYEATVIKHNGTFNLIQPTYTISVYNTRGNCVVEPNDRAYCVCKKLESCTS